MSVTSGLSVLCVCLCLCDSVYHSVCVRARVCGGVRVCV